MRPMKFKKISENLNPLGHDIIIILSKEICKVMHRLPTESEEKEYTSKVVDVETYTWAYNAICDGLFSMIHESDWDFNECYEFVEFM